MSTPGISVPFDLGTLGELGTEIKLTPDAEARAAMAGWLGIEGFDAFSGRVRLARAGDDSFTYDAHFDADVVQSCVVSLEPVRAHLTGEVSRIFRVPKKVRRKVNVEDQVQAAEIEVPLGEEEPELLESPILDLIGPVIEELALSLDPYPRAPGAAFAPPEAVAEPRESPFAVLKKLKDKG